jgi:hypothetical protein
MSRLPPKIEKVMDAVTSALAAGAVRNSEHANARMKERDILTTEVVEVLGCGFHEKKKDEFNELQNTWNYSIRGKTFEGRSIRVAVAIYAPDVLVLTTIDLDRVKK